jgi:glycerophosphoryl diester phosphodiesterase
LRRPRLYAHRGAASEQPENTIPSFERALTYGAHALEMDVHASSDGVILVSHDADGQRMCRESRAIKKTPYSEIRHWDAGWGFVSEGGDRPFAERDYRIPRLTEVLEHFPDTLINVDLKQGSPSIVGETLRLVRQAGAEDRVILASFSQATMLHVRLAGYRGATAMGPMELGAAFFAPGWIVKPWPLLGHASQIPTHAHSLTLATQERIGKLHALGARVDFWTINDVDEARDLLAMGADGIMTDDPKAVAPAFGL